MGEFNYNPVTGKYDIDSDLGFPIGGGPYVISALGAQEMGVSAGAARVTGLGLNAITLDNGVSNEAHFPFCVLPNADLSEDPIVRVCIAPGTAQVSGSDFKMQLVTRYVAEGESYTKAADETLTEIVTVSDTILTLVRFDFTLDGSKIEANDFITCILSRLGADPDDDRNGDAYLLRAGLITRTLQTSQE